MLEHDVVLNDRHRLRGAEVEVDIAEAADVIAREDAAGGRLGIEAGDAAGERERVVAGGLEVAERIALDHGHRQRHVDEALFAALRGDDDIAGVSLRVGGEVGVLREGGAGIEQSGDCRSRTKRAAGKYGFHRFPNLVLTFRGHTQPSPGAKGAQRAAFAKRVCSLSGRLGPDCDRIVTRHCDLPHCDMQSLQP
jgi:hypothetical protein